MHPAWGQTASNATKSPPSWWMTRAGSSVDGSVKEAQPPRGTSAEGPTEVPDGEVGAPDPWVVAVLPVPPPGRDGRSAGDGGGSADQSTEEGGEPADAQDCRGGDAGQRS